MGAVEVKVPLKTVNLVTAGGHVDTLVDHVVSCNELGSDHVSIIMHRWRQHDCSHVVLQPPRDAAVAPPIGADLLPRAAVADRPRFDTTMTLDSCPVRTASAQRASTCGHNPSTALTVVARQCGR